MNESTFYPPWVVLHVPHDSTEIPASVRDQFLLDEQELETEIRRMTDHRTFALFADSTEGANSVRATVSRLVVDVERFEYDSIEPMAARGMGAVYAVTSDLQPLRRPLELAEREALMAEYYRPHHARLEAAVDAVLERHGQCLIIDCHSFPSVPLPYEFRDPGEERPDICIGTDDFHTSDALASSFLHAFEAEAWRVSLNTPFEGALVPASRYRKDRRVSAVMIEVNRGVYLQEAETHAQNSFKEASLRVKRCCFAALANFESPISALPSMEPR